MSVKKLLNNGLVKAIFGGLFAFVMIFASVNLPLTGSNNVYAEPVEEITETEEIVELPEEGEETRDLRYDIPGV